ncbi:MIIP protein, partial [Heliornis fulica]|nr:MIIP protein [Heliornis fulica]
PGKEEHVTPVSEIIPCGRETSGVERDGQAQENPEKEAFPLACGESRKQSALLRDFHKQQPGCQLEPSLRKTPGEETSKQRVITGEPGIPTSTLPTSQARELEEGGHVAFQSDPEEYTMPVSSWSVHPFLGYDWIAGLLDTDSSIAEKSDQYFAELHEFRQANKEACVNEQHREPRSLHCLVPEQEPDLVTSSHKCVYCYRLNERLFTVPLDSEPACAVCKVPRT